MSLLTVRARWLHHGGGFFFISTLSSSSSSSSSSSFHFSSHLSLTLSILIICSRLFLPLTIFQPFLPPFPRFSLNTFHLCSKSSQTNRSPLFPELATVPFRSLQHYFYPTLTCTVIAPSFYVLSFSVFV
jgi:hypothetical protein